jgi:tetratricopeptide (TPR) repeat protein
MSIFAALCCLALAHPLEDRGSLQDYLVKAREQRALVQAGLKTKVDGLLREIDAAALARDQAALLGLRDKVAAIGAEGAPLLLPRLEPGATANESQKLASNTVTAALQALAPRGVTDDLVRMLANCSPEGRGNIVRVLSSAPDNDIAAQALAKLWREGPVEARSQVLAGLARMDAPEARQVLDGAFADARPEIVKLALEAVVQSANPAQAPRVLSVLKNPNEAGRNVDAIARYYGSVPQALDEAAITAIVSFAADPAPRPEDRSRLLESLAPRVKDFTSDIKKSLRKLADMPGATTRESALVLLAIGGDGKAKRDALASYDELIQRNSDWAQSHEARAALLYRMQEWKEARRDYEKAMELAARDLQGRQDAAAMGVARCFMQEGKAREAADILRKAPLTPKQLAELARDPLFAPILENPKLRESLVPR